MLCIAGTDGRFKKVNPAFERTRGFPTEELLRRPFYDFIHPDDHDRAHRADEAVGAPRLFAF